MSWGGWTPRLHRLDARAKSVVTLAFIAVLMSFDRHELSALTPFALFPAGPAVAGPASAAPLLRKIAVAAPFAIMVGCLIPGWTASRWPPWADG
jgi:cobalt/nickel transport system permease protein